MTEKIKFMLDQDKNEITFYFTENQFRDIVKEAIEKKVGTETLANNITEVCYLVSEQLCKELNLDFGKLKPNVIIE